MNFSSVIFLLVISSLFLLQISNPFDIPERAYNAPTSEFVETLTSDSTPNPMFDNLNSVVNSSVDTNSSSILTIANNPFEISKNKKSAQEDSQKTPRQRASTKTSKRKTPGLFGIDENLIVLIYSLTMLIIITMAISINKNRFLTIIKSTASSNQIRALFRDPRAWTNGQSLILYLIFFFNAAFFLWQINTKLDLLPQTRFFMVLVLVCIVYMVRHSIMWIMSLVYPVENQATSHSYSIAIHNQAFGVILLPFILAIEYLSLVTIQNVIYIALGLFLLNYLLRQGKSALMSVGSRNFSPFYFFLYLCAIEIAPILVTYRILIGAL